MANDLLRQRVLLTGATGFVGGRLWGPLRDEGYEVRCLTRDASKARSRWPARDWAQADITDEEALARALDGCAVAYYLVHGLQGARPGFMQNELAAAVSFTRAARAAGVGRIVYLGGVAPAGPASEHLQSRLETGAVLRAGRVPCLELRAGMIIGHGGASWRMVRDLAARLPAMILPRWLQYRSEPIGVDDVVAALIAAARLPLSASDWTDLPGPEVLSGEEILRRIAALLGRRPYMVPVPLLTPRLSSYWIRFVTGVDPDLARELVTGFTGDLLATRRDFAARAGLPPPLPFDTAVARALAEGEREASFGVSMLEGAAGWATRRG